MTTTTLGADCVGDACGRWGGLVIALIADSGLSDTAAAAAVGIARTRIWGHQKQCPSFAAALEEARELRRDARPDLPDRSKAATVLQRVAEGMRISDAAASVGVSTTTVYSWRRASPGFDAGFRRALENGRAKRGG